MILYYLQQIWHTLPTYPKLNTSFVPITVCRWSPATCSQWMQKSSKIYQNTLLHLQIYQSLTTSYHSLFYILIKSCFPTWKLLVEKIFQEMRKKGKATGKSLNISLCIWYKMFLTEFSRFLIYSSRREHKISNSPFLTGSQNFKFLLIFLSQYFIWSWISVSLFC